MLPTDSKIFSATKTPHLGLRIFLDDHTFWGSLFLWEIMLKTESKIFTATKTPPTWDFWRSHIFRQGGPEQDSKLLRCWSSWCRSLGLGEYFGLNFEHWNGLWMIGYLRDPSCLELWEFALVFTLLYTNQTRLKVLGNSAQQRLQEESVPLACASLRGFNLNADGWCWSHYENVGGHWVGKRRWSVLKIKA